MAERKERIDESSSRKRNACKDDLNTAPPNKVLNLNWKPIRAEKLDLSYLTNFLSRSESRELFDKLEQEVTYFSGDLAKVRVFGKWHDLPRQQVSRRCLKSLSIGKKHTSIWKIFFWVVLLSHACIGGFWRQRLEVHIFWLHGTCTSVDAWNARNKNYSRTYRAVQI